MSQTPRRTRVAISDFSIARILADDGREKKSRASGLSGSVRTLAGSTAGSGGTADHESFRSSVQREYSDAIGSFGLHVGHAFHSPFASQGTTPCDDREERISGNTLVNGSEDTGAKNERSELSWLQCTRYRPPKIPRKSAAGKSGKRRPGAHPRIPFTATQLQVLEDKYRRTAYLSRRDVIQLSTALRLPQSRVKIWFQNRRARDRRESTVSASNAMVLSADAPSPSDKAKGAPDRETMTPSPV